jgi:hypothetical protein
MEENSSTDSEDCSQIPPALCHAVVPEQIREPRLGSVNRQPSSPRDCGSSNYSNTDRTEQHQVHWSGLALVKEWNRSQERRDGHSERVDERRQLDTLSHEETTRRTRIGDRAARETATRTNSRVSSRVRGDDDGLTGKRREWTTMIIILIRLI